MGWVNQYRRPSSMNDDFSGAKVQTALIPESGEHSVSPEFQSLHDPFHARGFCDNEVASSRLACAANAEILASPSVP